MNKNNHQKEADTGVNFSLKKMKSDNEIENLFISICF